MIGKFAYEIINDVGIIAKKMKEFEQLTNTKFNELAIWILKEKEN